MLKVFDFLLLNPAKSRRDRLPHSGCLWQVHDSTLVNNQWGMEDSWNAWIQPGCRRGRVSFPCLTLSVDGDIGTCCNHEGWFITFLGPVRKVKLEADLQFGCDGLLARLDNFWKDDWRIILGSEDFCNTVWKASSNWCKEVEVPHGKGSTQINNTTNWWAVSTKETMTKR